MAAKGPTKKHCEIAGKVLAAGNTRRLLADLIDVHEDTIGDWMRRTEPKHERFKQAVIEAEAQAEQNLVAAITKAGQRSWRANAWLLERRWPERWADKTEAPENGGDDDDDDEPKNPLAEYDELAERRRAAKRT